MSIVACVCGAIIDSDDELDCFIGDDAYCETCLENLADEPCDHVLDLPQLDPNCKCASCMAREALA